jgi:hypothetical protein
VPYVLTVDQVASRTRPDLVDATLTRLRPLPTVLPFTRTVGDEFQGLLGDPLSVLDAILVLMRDTSWHVGLGIGPVEQPLPADDPRSARGAAFLAARSAVDRAKNEAAHLAVVAAAPAEPEGIDVEAVLRLLAEVRRRRTDAGWEVADLAVQGLTQAETADRLGITRQAVQQRLRTAGWAAEESARPTVARLLARAERSAGS